MRPLFKLFVIIALISGFTSNASAGSVGLAWDPNSESDLAGYKAYYRTSSTTYGTPIDVGLVTRTTLMGLVPGVTYYFVVTAYNTSGLESGFSNEVSYTIPISICDLNNDGYVDEADVREFIIRMWNATLTSAYDFNKDNDINVLDVVYMINTIVDRKSCP